MAETSLAAVAGDSAYVPTEQSINVAGKIFTPPHRAVRGWAETARAAFKRPLRQRRELAVTQTVCCEKKWGHLTP